MRLYGNAALHQQLPVDASQDDRHAAIEKFNDDPLVDAFLVQLSLPRHLNEEQVLLAVN